MSDGSAEDWFGAQKVFVLFEDDNGNPVRLKSSNGYLQTVPGTVTPRDAYPLSAAVTVSTRAVRSAIFCVTSAGGVQAPVR